jgi:autotransporter-associated beta strand protein
MKITDRTHRLRFLLLQISAASALLAASSVHAADGTWNVNANGTWSTTTNWLSNIMASGSGSTANFTNDITADRTVTLDSSRTLTNVVFGDSNTATAGSWIISNTATNLTLQGTTPTITVNALGTGKTATILANVRGTAGLTKAGAGMLVLTKGTGGLAASFPSGALTVNSGTLRVNNTGISTGNNDLLTLGSMTTINNGSTLEFTQSSSEGRVKFSGGVTFGATGGNTLAMNTGAGTGNSALVQGSYTFTTLGGTTNYITTNAGAFFNMQNTAGNYVIFDVADGTAATDLEVSMAVTTGGIRKSGAGVLTLTNNNTNINNLDITAGTLELAGGGRITNVGSSAGTFSLSFTNNGTLLYNGTNAQTLSGVISGSGSLTKSGNATLTVSGSNTYSGNTTINAGTLTAATSTALGSGSVSIGSGASLRLDPGAILGNAITTTSTGSILFAGGGLQRTSSQALSTVAQLVAGGTGASVALDPAFAWSARIAGVTYSDVLDLTNTHGTIQILQMAYDESLLAGGSESEILLGWNSSGSWVNAIDGNTGSAGGSALTNANGGYASLGILPTAAYLGSWGRDTTAKTVWAVVNHNSDYAAIIVVPEPGALSLAGIGAAVAAWCVIRRRHP